MTDTIPQDILDAAEKALLAYKTEKPSDAALLGHIARAIMAEREWNAKVADDHVADFERQARVSKGGRLHDALLMASDGCDLVAAAIRAGR